MARGKKISAIVEIPLPNGLNTYARVYKSYTIGIYKGFYKTFDHMPQKNDFFRLLDYMLQT